ncbi:hypothetical protein SAMN05892883_4191 [Jatrophihabitans sp. GAS493]|uniref:hypothetical protein n=1 Tax=Jatrophihabitans sp. GAS493 TaxID=1907575 RepID=UPI000BBF5537|nr:hypothetical protein [Jatrophihabitans sp. GAS493]SOD74993.1 hypothetical protein SAMN05892883_4191 [Jatrophihabitans sp. GAS493]
MTMTTESDQTERVELAAHKLFDAECALHVAHQTHVDAWVDAANRKLHDAISDLLAAEAESGSTSS